MHRLRFKRLFHSVFTKLLVTILFAGALISLIVGFGFAHMRFHSFSQLDRNLLVYAEYLVGDLGDPPDIDRAEKIARRTGFAIRYEHQDGGWQTGIVPEMLQIKRARVRSHGNGIWTGQYRGRFFHSQSAQTTACPLNRCQRADGRPTGPSGAGSRRRRASGSGRSL